MSNVKFDGLDVAQTGSPLFFFVIACVILGCVGCAQ